MLLFTINYRRKQTHISISIIPEISNAINPGIFNYQNKIPYQSQYLDFDNLLLSTSVFLFSPNLLICFGVLFNHALHKKLTEYIDSFSCGGLVATLAVLFVFVCLLIVCLFVCFLFVCLFGFDEGYPMHRLKIFLHVMETLIKHVNSKLLKMFQSASICFYSVLPHVVCIIY